jgi:predicted amidophosphoribosyltransferase
VPAGLDGCWSLLAYDGPARELVTRLKYRNHRAAVAWLADGMAALLEPPPGAVVTWAPTSERRRRARGFDQAELLAAAVARRWGVPCRRLLTRSSASPPQTGLSLAARRRGPTFAGAPGAIDAGAAILVDDVVTTGSTLTAAAGELRAGGVGWVVGLTAARTPRLTVTVPALSVSATPPDVEVSLKFGAQRADTEGDAGE